jgi:hypothetical protein
MNMTKFILAGLAGLMVLNTSCTQYQAQGAGVGALAGGAIGAMAGDRHDALRGAAIGAALGTGVAAIQENERRKAEADAEYYRGGQNRESGYPDETPSRPRPNSGSSGQNYPTAERTENPDRVISPYGPNFNVIDVSGFRSGQLARDPSNQKIFRVP